MTERRVIRLGERLPDDLRLDDLIELPNHHQKEFGRLTVDDHQALIWWKGELGLMLDAQKDYFERIAKGMAPGEQALDAWTGDQAADLLVSLSDAFQTTDMAEIVSLKPFWKFVRDLVAHERDA